MHNEVDRRTGVEIGIQIIEIGDQVRASWKSNALVQTKGNLWYES